MTFLRQIVPGEKSYDCGSGYIRVVAASDDFKRAATVARDINHGQCAAVVLTDNTDTAPILKELGALPNALQIILGFNDAAQFENNFEKQMTEEVAKHRASATGWKKFVFNLVRSPTFNHLKNDVRRSLELINDDRVNQEGFLLRLRNMFGFNTWNREEKTQDGRARIFIAQRSFADPGLLIAQQQKDREIRRALNCGQSLAIVKSRVWSATPVRLQRTWSYTIEPSVFATQNEYFPPDFEVKPYIPG